MSKKNKAKKTKLPLTLIIGLGGTGCDIISRVNRLASPEQKDFIRFVFFDTDANELRARKEEFPSAFTVQTSRRMTVGQALRNDSESREYSFPINPQLLSKPLTEGAGQVRAISKLAFDACLREGRISELHSAIDELQKLNGDEMEQSMRVVIVSTLVGGTGSGILLPLSLYLRHYLETNCQKKPIIRGICVLPDVFFHDSGKTEIEKNNLRANAYATLRELDAFMLRSDSEQDSDLRKRYWMKMPRPGTADQYDEYNENPMDFCFLFDGQNIDGDGLQTLEEYKQHAADCIYASSISKLNKRLNSSEDNTILQRCEESGRNRYCGIGTSKMQYPFADVRDYIALKWMEQAVSENWLRYDRLYENEVAKNQKSRANGVLTKPVDRHEFYSNTIASEQGESNFFSLSVYEECYNKDRQGLEFTDPRWSTYYEKLKLYIDNKVAQDTDYDDGLGKSISAYMADLSNAVQQLENFASSYPQLEEMMKLLFTKTRKHAEAIASSVADSIFSPDNFNTASEHHIEHWLTQNGVPLHPNSIRFFLYNLEKLLKEELNKLTMPSTDSDEYADMEDGFEEEKEPSFADLENSIRKFFTEEIKPVPTKNESGTSYVRRSQFVMLLNSRRNGLSKAERQDAAMEIVTECQNHLKHINDFYGMYLRKTIIDKALVYIGNLCKNYERFYDQLAVEIKRIPRRIARLEEAFKNDSGNPIMYVCASKKCLDGMMERCLNTVDPIQLTPEFREKLFQGIFSSMSLDDKKQKGIIADLASTELFDFWRKTVLETYPKYVDMDILDALCAEAEFEEEIYDAEDQFHYIEGKYREAMKLSAPFIDRPIGREPYIISACGMSTEVNSEDDVQKAITIRRVFENCERDPLMDKYQILFMQAMYNLRISDLQKFSPKDTNPVDPHDAGEYYKSYMSRINNILPDTNKTKILTPHLDKRWHYTGILPDLDDRNEQKLIAEAQTAFFISLAYGYVRFCEDQYRFIDEKGDYMSDAIIVSDGKCDKFHEVYDAMLINRPLVRSFLARYAASVEKEKTDAGIGNRDFDSSALYQSLGKMHFVQYNDIPIVSCMELPLLYKASMGNSEFDDSSAIQMLQGFMDFIEEYLKNFYPNQHRRDQYVVEWLGRQAKLMLNNIASYYDNPDCSRIILAKPFTDIMLARMVNNILARIRSYETCGTAQIVADKLDELWDGLKSNADRI